jgi:hypothetical protein
MVNRTHATQVPVKKWAHPQFVIDHEILETALKLTGNFNGKHWPATEVNPVSSFSTSFAKNITYACFINPNFDIKVSLSP